MAVATRSDKRWWATIGIGVVACVGCCAALPLALPLLAALGLAGSGALLVGVGWLEPIGVGLIATGVIGVAISRIRAGRRAARGVDRGEGTSCGCASPHPVLLDPTGSAQR